MHKHFPDEKDLDGFNEFVPSDRIPVSGLPDAIRDQKSAWLNTISVRAVFSAEVEDGDLVVPVVRDNANEWYHPDTVWVPALSPDAIMEAEDETGLTYKPKFYGMAYKAINRVMLGPLVYHPSYKFRAGDILYATENGKMTTEQTEVFVGACLSPGYVLLHGTAQNIDLFKKAAELTAIAEESAATATAMAERVVVEGEAQIKRLEELAEQLLIVGVSYNKYAVANISTETVEGTQIALPYYEEAQMSYIVGSNTLLLIYNGTWMLPGEQYEEVGTAGLPSAIVKLKQELRPGDKLGVLILSQFTKVLLALDSGLGFKENGELYIAPVTATGTDDTRSLPDWAHAITKLEKPIATGSTEARTLQDRFADVINVKDFGAKGDGVTDDKKAIQDFVDYLANKGGIGIIPTGTYLISNTIGLDPNNLFGHKSFTIIGEGLSTRLVLTNTAPSHAVILKKCKNITISNLVIDAGREGLVECINSGGGVYCVDCSDMRFINVRFERFEYCGLIAYLSGTYEISSENWLVDGCVFDGSSNYFVERVDSGDSKYHSALILTSVRNSTVINTKAYKCLGYGLEYKGFGAYSYGTSENNSFVNCYTELCNRGGYYFGGEGQDNIPELHLNCSVHSCTAHNCVAPFVIGATAYMNVSGLLITYDDNYPFETVASPIYISIASHHINIACAVYKARYSILNVKGGSHDCNILFEHVSLADGVASDLLVIQEEENVYNIQATQLAGSVLSDNISRDITAATNNCSYKKASGRSLHPTAYRRTLFIGAPATIVNPASSFEGLAFLAKNPGLHFSCDSSKGNVIRSALSSTQQVALRFRPDMAALQFYAFVDGVETPLYLFNDARFTPNSDNTLALGYSSARWSQVFAATSTINTSDKRDKISIEDPDKALMCAWDKVGFRIFQFKDAVNKKGSEARLHVGMIAQDVLEVFASEGLDATRYGLLCYDKWEDEYEDVEVVDSEAILDAEGNEIAPAKTHTEKKLVTPAGDRYGIRYAEALCLEAAYQRRRADRIEARLAALEAKSD